LQSSGNSGIEDEEACPTFPRKAQEISASIYFILSICLPYAKHKNAESSDPSYDREDAFSFQMIDLSTTHDT
jgi:hypothetical protein